MTVHLGVIGGGSNHAFHAYIKSIAEFPGQVELSGVQGPRPENLRQLEFVRSSGTPVFSAETEMFERCDAILIASPDVCHIDQIEAALKAGKHVLAEKPLV